MKKFFKLAAIAAVAMLTVVACKNNKPAEEVIDSTAIETIAEEDVIDTMLAIADTTPVVEEQAATAKKVVKKATTPTVTEAPIDNTSKNVKTVAPSNPTEKVDANADVQKNTEVKRTRR
jgi:hypothetical protein